VRRDFPYAKKLGVLPLEVARWLEGDEHIPEPVFLASIAIVLDLGRWPGAA
jgi:hypothetical protein